MKKKYFFPISLIFLNCGFSEEIETNHLSSDSTIPTESHANEMQQLLSDESPSHPVEDGQDSTTASPSERSYAPACSMFRTMHVGLRHTEARGVGYKDGYTTLEVFGIYDRNDSLMPFLDIRGHVFDDGKFAGNVGIGGRSYFSSIHHVLGYYCYYDVRQDNHHLTAQQVSPGIELLGNRMEYRLNGYFPVGEDESHKYGFKFNEFDEHRIILKAKQKHVMTGGDAEIGVHLTQSLKYDAYLGAGPYYFSSSHDSSWGGKARLLGRYKQYIALEASYSYDHLFGNVVQGTIAFNLPFGPKLKKKDQACTSRANLSFARAAFAPYRFEIPVIKKVSRKEKAINPATGKPWTVWFVNNTSSSDGTFESPFPTLVQAQNASAPNDMIYVFPGDGTTKGMNMGIILKDGQKFFGSGISQKIHTAQGKVTIPAFSQINPTITSLNPALTFNVIIPANGNEISGFNMIVSIVDNTAIFSPVPIQGINVHQNNISASVGHNGILLTGSGKMLATNNQFSGDGTHLAIALTAAPGMELTGKASDNIITGYNTGVDMNLTTNSVVDFEISNNTMSFLVTPILWTIASANPASSNALISGNSISSYAFNAILVAGVAPNATTQIIGNTVYNNIGGDFSNGIVFSVSQPPNAGQVIIANNNVVTSTSHTNTNSILAETTGATSFTADISNNQVTIAQSVGPSAVGINVRAVNNSTICAAIIDNQLTIQHPGAVGINAATTGTGIINIELAGNVPPNVSFSGNVNPVAPGTCGP